MDNLKALSVKSVHALRIALGQKTLEIRSKPTHYRGPLVICVSKKSDGPAPDKVINLLHLGFRSDSGIGGPLGRPEGHALCVVDVVGWRKMLPGDEADAMHDYVPGAFVWKLANVRLIEPFPVRGRLSFFEVHDSLIRYRRTAEDRLSIPRTEFPPSPRNESRSSQAVGQALVV